MNEHLRITALTGFVLGMILWEWRETGWGANVWGILFDMDTLTIVLIVAVVLLLVFLIVGKTSGGAGISFDFGTIQSILILLILLFLAIWLGQMVLG